MKKLLVLVSGFALILTMIFSFNSRSGGETTTSSTPEKAENLPNVAVTEPLKVIKNLDLRNNKVVFVTGVIGGDSAKIAKDILNLGANGDEVFIYFD